MLQLRQHHRSSQQRCWGYTSIFCRQERRQQAHRRAAQWGNFRELEVVKGESLLAGLMYNAQGTGKKALFLAAGADSKVVFRIHADQPVVFRMGEETLARMPDRDGWCEIEIPASRGGLLTCNDE